MPAALVPAAEQFKDGFVPREEAKIPNLEPESQAVLRVDPFGQRLRHGRNRVVQFPASSGAFQTSLATGTRDRAFLVPQGAASVQVPLSGMGTP